jgi:signal peptidase II
MTDGRPAVTKPEEGIERRLAVLIFVLMVALVVAADQVSKSIVSAAIPLDSGTELVPGILNLVHARNPGAAFGMLASAGARWRPVFFIGISVAALVVIVLLLLGSSRIGWRLLGGYSLFFAGTLGNLVDRIRFGEVVDFIDVHVGAWHWPAFNVADSALCVGSALFLLHFLWDRRRMCQRCGGI